MEEIKLSICIPVYNRRDYIGETLDSINNQENIEEFKDMIEIVVSDNASIDGTSEFVQEYSQNSKVKIVYSRSDVNLGADRNYLRVVSLASGKYCWFLGSDDCIVAKGVKYILEEIKEKYEIYLCGRYRCKCKDLQIIEEEHFLFDWIKDTVFDFGEENVRSYYFNCCKSIGGVFSYISSIVFSREAWNSIEFDESYIGTAYAHVYMLLNIVERKVRLKYIYEALILGRLGNDSFYENRYQRTMLDFDGYLKLAKIIKDEKERKFFLNILTRERRTLELLKDSLIFNKEQRNNLFNVMEKVGYPKEDIGEIKRINEFRYLFLIGYVLVKIKKDFKIWFTNAAGNFRIK